MKRKIQYISSICSLCIIAKSFFFSTNYVDAVNIIVCASIFCLLEVLNNTKLQKELILLRKTNNEKFNLLEKDLNDTKNYVSKLSTSSAFRR